MHEWDAKTAECYADKYGEYATNRLALNALEGVAPLNVLDLGCGAGAALRHASTLWPAARLVGVDPVPRMIEIAQERLSGHEHEGRIELRVGSAEEVPAEDNSFDLVLAFDSLDHWGDVPRGAREVSRVLASGGHFVVVKDQGVPADGKDVVELFEQKAGFKLESNRGLEREGVSFAMWVFVGALC